MLLKQVMQVVELLDRPEVPAEDVARLFAAPGVPGAEIHAERGPTLMFKLLIPGSQGKSTGGDAPTLGITGYLGGIGARPQRIGLVSDADGCVATLAAALKLVQMHRDGDRLPGDVLATTHITTHAVIKPHHLVTFMDSPVDIATRNRYLVDPRMEAILSLDTTRGNRIINHRGFALTPTVKEGYVLRVSEDLLQIQQDVTGRLPLVLAITTQDITPYGNGIFHLNGMMQPATVTGAPVVGVAITSEVAVSGAATGVSHEVDIEAAARFAVEVAKAFAVGSIRFYDPAEFERLVNLYGSMRHLQTLGQACAGA